MPADGDQGRRLNEIGLLAPRDFMRTLAVDLGACRVGFALSDAGGSMASPLEVLAITQPAQATARVLQLIRQEQVQRVVVGLPLNMDDTIGPAARSTVAWGRSLALEAHIDVVFVDERLSSFQGEQTLIERKRSGEKITRRQKKQNLDAIAAAGFLQSFLDGKLASIDVDRI